MHSYSPPPVEGRWSAPGAGDKYAHQRFASTRSASRDPRMVLRLARRYCQPGQPGHILDVPSGTGRLQSALSGLGPVTAVDVSASMLEARRTSTGAGNGIQASAWQLPLRPDSFDLVVSCRLLHHIADPAARATVVAQLLRVSRGLVFASFWDAHSWHAMRRRRGWRNARHPDGRVAVARKTLAADFEAAGGRVLGYAHSLRWISPQAWIAVEAP